jgi:hypothetical protein
MKQKWICRTAWENMEHNASGVLELMLNELSEKDWRIEKIFQINSSYVVVASRWEK